MRRLDMPDISGSTPLMLAIHAGAPGVARTLPRTPRRAPCCRRRAKAGTLDRRGKAPIC
jgi:hypothetical protein